MSNAMCCARRSRRPRSTRWPLRCDVSGQILAQFCPDDSRHHLVERRSGLVWTYSAFLPRIEADPGGSRDIGLHLWRIRFHPRGSARIGLMGQSGRGAAGDRPLYGAQFRPSNDRRWAGRVGPPVTPTEVADPCFASYPTGVRHETPFSACSQCSVMVPQAGEVRREQHGQPERGNTTGGSRR